MPTSLPPPADHPRFLWSGCLLIAVLGVFYIATIREGHVWGDDHAAYLAHARNLVEGRHYGDIGYLRAPTSINALMYPPVYPLLLAPVYQIFGLNLTPMKIEGIVFFCLALWFLYLLLRKHGEITALTAVGLTGLCPYFWDFKDSLFSEFPFLAFLFAVLWVSERFTASARGSWRREIAWGVLVGVLIGIACGARGIGVILAPVIIFLDWWKSRRMTLFGLAAGVVSVALVLGQNWWFGVNSDYATPYAQSATVRSLAGSPWFYTRCFTVIWENGFSTVAQWGLFVLTAIAAARGFAVRFRQGVSVLEVFFVAYFLFVCLFPWGGRRYLMPLFPLYFYYLLVGLQAFAASRPALRAPLFASAGLLIACCFAGRYLQHDWRRVDGGVGNADADALVSHIQSDSGAKDAVIVFCKARWLAFYTGAKVADVHEPGPDFDRFYESIGATRFVVSKIFGDQQESQLAAWVEQSAHRLERRFANDSFSVYALK
jgi:hypothetical protein